MPNAQCPLALSEAVRVASRREGMPNAQCPMPNAPCPINITFP
ncbi:MULTISPECIES: hypothetical protein [unclassified Calothrix]|nr:MULTISPECIES: hypothetical protein [unclassified Calothrix]